MAISNLETLQDQTKSKEKLAKMLNDINGIDRIRAIAKVGKGSPDLRKVASQQQRRPSRVDNHDYDSESEEGCNTPSKRKIINLKKNCLQDNANENQASKKSLFKSGHSVFKDKSLNISRISKISGKSKVSMRYEVQSDDDGSLCSSSEEIDDNNSQDDNEMDDILGEQEGAQGVDLQARNRILQSKNNNSRWAANNKSLTPDNTRNKCLSPMDRPLKSKRNTNSLFLSPNMYAVIC